MATDASKKGTSTTVFTTVELSNSIILARPNPLRTLIYWFTLPEEKYPDDAVILTVPSTASGVIVALGFDVEIVNA